MGPEFIAEGDAKKVNHQRFSQLVSRTDLDRVVVGHHALPQHQSKAYFQECDYRYHDLVTCWDPLAKHVQYNESAGRCVTEDAPGDFFVESLYVVSNVREEKRQVNHPNHVDKQSVAIAVELVELLRDLTVADV